MLSQQPNTTPGTLPTEKEKEMDNRDRIRVFEVIEKIKKNCVEIQHALEELIQRTSNQNYRESSERDKVSIGNLISIANCVKEDLEKDKIGKCMELFLRVTVKDFEKKLSAIPVKKNLRMKILKHLNEIHEKVLMTA